MGKENVAQDPKENLIRVDFSLDKQSINVSKYLRIIKCVLGVEHSEHSLIKLGKEFPQSLLQVNVSVFVIILEIFEEVGKDIRISFVQNAISFLEHVVEVSFRAGQHFSEKF